MKKFGSWFVLFALSMIGLLASCVSPQSPQ